MQLQTISQDSHATHADNFAAFKADDTPSKISQDWAFIESHLQDAELLHAEPTTHEALF